MKEFFWQWGEVEYASVSLDRETRKSRWFGFVTFINAEDAAKAKEEANEQELEWRPIYIDFAKAREEVPAPATNEEESQENEEEENEEQAEENEEAQE